LDTHTGRHELNEINFNKFKANKEKDFQALDFKKLFPKILENTDKMPRRLEYIWRMAADAYLENEKGLYFFQAKGCLVHFTFDNVVGALAKAQIDNIGKYIEKSFQSSLEDGGEEYKLIEAPENRPKQTDNKAGGNNNLKKVLEGLRKNPEISEVTLWASRSLQNLHLSRSIPQDMLKLREEYKICYVPLWNAENGVLVGASCELNPRGIAADNDGQIIRDNIALITAARQEIERLHTQNKQAVLIVPIYIKSLLEKDVTELITTFLNKTAEPIRKSMIFELRGIGKDQIQVAAKEPLETISQICRALIIDTGILAHPDMEREPFKIHAYGCNYNDVNLPPEQRLNLMKKYASTYKARGQKIYIRNIPNIAALEKAQELRFTYINAPSVLMPKLFCPAATRMSLPDIKAI
jgi:hypothetical protein